jgi:glutamate/tyrosine decarboxylase-like PLP-dependent enzyme
MMVLQGRSEIHPKPADKGSASSFLSKPAPRYRFPKEGIERAAAYQLVHDELLLDGTRGRTWLLSARHG